MAVLTQGWHTLVDTIRLLPLYPKHNSDSTGAEREHDLAAAIEEKNTLDDALDQVALLIRLREGETLPPYLLPTLTAKVPTRSPIPPPRGTASSSASASASNSAAASVPPAPTISTAAASPAPQTAGVKRKHRVSVSASPAPPSLTSARDGHMAPLTSSRHASPMPGTSKASAAQQAQQRQVPRNLTKKEILQDQLPLLPGRKVAYRVPPNLNEDQDPDAPASWIACVVKKSAAGDKAKYEVLDEDDGTM